MKGTLLSLILAIATLAEPAYAQFGGGIVLDPTQSAHAAQQLIQGSQLYTTTIKTTQNVMEAYNLAQRMATAPSSYYTAYTNMAQQTWTPVAHPANTYGNSLPWVSAATTGSGASAANQAASIQRTGQISGYGAEFPRPAGPCSPRCDRRPRRCGEYNEPSNARNYSLERAAA